MKPSISNLVERVTNVAIIAVIISTVSLQYMDFHGNVKDTAIGIISGAAVIGAINYLLGKGFRFFYLPNSGKN